MRKSEAGAVLLSPLGVREALMRRHVWLGGVTLVAAMALSNCTDKVGIQVSERFTADLKGTNERPTQVTTTATGSATFTYVADIPALFYRIDVAGVGNALAGHNHARSGERRVGEERRCPGWPGDLKKKTKNARAGRV